MKIYTSLAYGERLKELKKLELGIMLATGYNVQNLIRKEFAEFPCAFDNGAFTFYQRGYPFQEKFFWETLEKCYSCGIFLDFIVCPDLYGGGIKSYEYSLEWANGKLRSSPNLALVVSDPLKPSDIALADLKIFSSLFVGASKDWKGWIDFAHRIGMKCHIGKCGTLENLRYAESLGADSVDSSNFSRHDSARRALLEFRSKGQKVFEFDRESEAVIFPNHHEG